MEIYNEDCFETFKKIKEGTIDLFLLDLPYGQTACEWDKIIDLEEMWKEIKRTMKEEASIVFFATTKFGYKLIQSNEKWFRYDLVWKKNIPVGFFNCNNQPLRSHEMIYIFRKKGGIYNPQKGKGKPYKKKPSVEETVYGKTKRIEKINLGDRYPTSILEYSRSSKTVHKTQKPLGLCEWLIKTYSNENDTVMDFTMGSGTTGLACKNTNRKFIGVEKDPEIFKIANERLNNK